MRSRSFSTRPDALTSGIENTSFSLLAASSCACNCFRSFSAVSNCALSVANLCGFEISGAFSRQWQVVVLRVVPLYFLVLVDLRLETGNLV